MSNILMKSVPSQIVTANNEDIQQNTIHVQIQTEEILFK